MNRSNSKCTNYHFYRIYNNMIYGWMELHFVKHWAIHVCTGDSFNNLYTYQNFVARIDAFDLLIFQLTHLWLFLGRLLLSTNKFSWFMRICRLMLFINVVCHSSQFFCHNISHAECYSVTKSWYLRIKRP